MATVAEQPSGVPIPIPTPPSPSPSLPSSTPTTSTSPSFPFPRPRSPTKGELPHLQRATTDIKPNAHPYPIKTTSTALLSRSNSVSASPATKHHYVPLPPSPSPSHSNSYSGSGAAGAKDKRTTEYRGHRYSRSLSSSEDMYLPHSHHAASSSGGDATGNTNGNASASPQGPRALPIPPGVSNNSIASMNMAANKNTNANANGTSPKRWTPAQLAAHLDRTISREAGEWAARRGVGGRAFMRMAEEEMAAMGAPAPATLRPAARALRQEVLQGQLDVSSSPVSSGSESPTRRMMNASPTRGLNASPTRGLNASPTRIDEGEEDGEGDADDNTPSRRGATPHIRASAAPWTSTSPSPSPFTTADSPRARNGHGHGRVRGMVRTLESSGSEGGSGSEWDGSPERGGSGFRRVRVGSNANGYGNGGAGGEIRNGHGNGSGFRQQHANGSQVSVGSQSGGEESDGMNVGGTMRPQRSLPARPDGVEVGVVDLGGATVRAGGDGNGNGNGSTTVTAPGEDELTVEELLALEPQGTGSGSWRRAGRRSGHGRGHGHKHEQNNTSAEGLVSQHSTGGRPLPPQPPRAARSSSGGVHAWEADEGLVGNTVKRVPVSTPTHAHAAAPFEVPGRVVVAPAASSASAAQSHAERKALEEEAAARGRERGRAVRAQVADAKREGAVLRDIVEEFRARLEEVERKVGAMEVAAAYASASAAAPPSIATPAIVPPASSTLTRLDPRRLLAAFFGSASTMQDGNGDLKTRGRGAENDFVGPTTIRALPSYVLLVGLGVCAVVLRVLVRRGVGAVRRRA